MGSVLKYRQRTTAKDVIPITKKEVIAHLNGSPLMQSIRNGTLEELTEFRKTFNEQIRERKIATWRSYGYAFLISVIGCSLIFRLFHPTLQELFIGHISSLLICSGIWGMTAGSRFRTAAMMEKVIITLVDAAIQEKKIPQPNATN